ncbi:MAG: PilW family protein, partial [Microbacteriaceae bacterium]
EDHRMTRRGMTLVEMMVAVTATLILMGAVAQVFSVFGSAVSNSRAMLELDSRLRVVANRLRTDLKGITACTLPPRSPDTAEGYFEIIEGPWKESDVGDGADVARTDVDDVLLFTARSPSAPFVGRGPNGTFESPVAEVAWFARETVDPSGRLPVTFTLYRKQLLVLGYVGVAPFSSSNAASFPGWSVYYSGTGNWPYDISARRVGMTLYPNSLADLTCRENRFMHNITGTFGPAAFPSPFVDHATAVDGLIFSSTSTRYGEDVVLTNVLTFDVRVFDPAAPVHWTSSTALVPQDPGPFSTGTACGGYVDLGNNVTTNDLLSAIGKTPRFAGFGESKSGLAGSGITRRVYDTWSTHYEANGLNEDGDAQTDEGTDGIDSPVVNGQVDELGEFETLPPYPAPLRGIEVRIRCWEPSSRQVRQVTVRHTFVPH